jgi:hypothetical protein
MEQEYANQFAQLLQIQGWWQLCGLIGVIILIANVVIYIRRSGDRTSGSGCQNILLFLYGAISFAHSILLLTTAGKLYNGEEFAKIWAIAACVTVLLQTFILFCLFFCIFQALLINDKDRTKIK